jgi:hypothetical protein
MLPMALLLAARLYAILPSLFLRSIRCRRLIDFDQDDEGAVMTVKTHQLSDGPTDTAEASNKADGDSRIAGPEIRYLNRELSWLEFNQRVLYEANNAHHPLLERLRFLSISCSNMDEFYIVRVAGLKGQVSAGVAAVSDDGLTPRQQLAAVMERAATLMRDQQTRWIALRNELRENRIAVVEPPELTSDDRAWLAEKFQSDIYPLLTPLAVDPAHPFPFVPNRGFGLALQLHDQENDQELNALVLLPSHLERFVRLPGQNTRFIPAEQVVLLFIDRLFPGSFRLLNHGIFRVLRDSEIEIDEKAEDLVRTFESALKRRRLGHVIRLTVDRVMDAELREFLRMHLGVSSDDIFLRDGLWCINRVGDGFRPLCWCSGDLAGDRHAEAGHAVDRRAGDPGFDLLRGQSPGAEAPADQNLVPMESGFNQGPLAVTNGFLPAYSAFPGEHLDVPVALSGLGVCSIAQNRV